MNSGLSSLAEADISWDVVRSIQAERTKYKTCFTHTTVQRADFKIKMDESPVMVHQRFFNIYPLVNVIPLDWALIF